MKIYSTTKHNSNIRNNFGYKQIELTQHVKFQAEKRFNITSSNELKKLASSAKKNGVHINYLTYDNCEDFGIGKKAFNLIKKRIKFGNFKGCFEIYLYKEIFFLFGGNHNRTLITVFELNTKDKEKIEISGSKIIKGGVIHGKTQGE